MHAESAANRKCLCLNSSESGKVCRRRICSDFYFDKAVMTCRVRLRFSSDLLILSVRYFLISPLNLPPTPPPSALWEWAGTHGLAAISRSFSHMRWSSCAALGLTGPFPGVGWAFGHRVLPAACRAAAAHSCSLTMQGCRGRCRSRTQLLILGTQLGPGV